MPITGTCPACGTKGPLETFVLEEKYKRAILEAFRLPAPLADLVLNYIGLFAPPSGRAIRADKLARVVRELRELVTSGEVTRKGITHGATIEAWRYGIEQTLDAHRAGTLELPLDDHNYAASIVWRTVNKAAGQAERKKEADLQQRRDRRKEAEQADQRGEKIRKLTAELLNLKQLVSADKTGRIQSEIDTKKAELEALRNG